MRPRWGCWGGTENRGRRGPAFTVLGALAAGIIEGPTWRVQLRAAAAYCAFAVTFLVAMVTYLRLQPSGHWFRILLPLIAGVIPFLVVREILRLLVVRGAAGRADEPSIAAVAAAVIILFTVVTSWSLFRPTLEADSGSPQTKYNWVIDMTSDGALSYQGKPLPQAKFSSLCRRIMSLHPDSPHELHVRCPRGTAGLAARTLDPLLNGCGPHAPGLQFQEAE